MNIFGQEITREQMGATTNAQADPTFYNEMMQDVLNKALQAQMAVPQMAQGGDQAQMAQGGAE